MTTIQRQRVSWTGFPGAPGLSTFYFTDAALHQAALRAFFSVVAVTCPPDVTITVEPGGDTIEDTTGILSGSWVGTAAPGVVGTGSSNYSAPAGGLFRWDTGTIHYGRRHRARTYVVPMANSAFDAQGKVGATIAAGLTTEAQDLIAAHVGNMLAWARNHPATPSWTDVKGRVHPARAARAGLSESITSGQLLTESVVLRSRRD